LPHIRSITFWLGGIIAPHLWQLTRDALALNGAPPTPNLCYSLLDLGREASAGALDSDAYCRRAAELASVRIAPAQLAADIESRITITPGILGLLDELGVTYQLYLMSDYPDRWLRPLLQGTGLGQRFSDRSIIMASAYGGIRQPADLQRALATVQVVPLDEALVIDPDSRRVMAEIRAGIKAALFVDVRRLRREFVLWAMLPPV
jgi:FMN phosphatase YigB (HAD superfamily)